MTPLPNLKRQSLKASKDQDKIARMMQQLIEQIGEKIRTIFRRSILMKKKNSIN